MDMEEKFTDNNEKNVDIQRLLGAVLNKAWLVALVAILCAVVTFASTLYFVTPKYSASSMFYVNNSNISIGNTSLNITPSDISASKDLVNSYIVILMTRETLRDVVDYADVDLSYAQVASMISAMPVNNTEVFRIVVTSADPELSMKVAHAIEEILPNRIKKIVEGTSAKVVDTAVLPSSPSSPNYVNNTIIGFLIGLLVSVAIIVLVEWFDTKIHSEEDITRICEHPILAAVPDMTATDKGAYYSYGYGNVRKKKANGDDKEEPKLIGADISFAAGEAYKRLRTKLQFAFSDERNSRVIGISSALSGEGKSVTAINLAHSLSLLNKKVVLVDCDMRRPSVATKLTMEKTPGLSSYLSGQSNIDTLVQKCILANEGYVFDTVTAGRNPPNPIELLSSDKMVTMLEQLREKYDYIILDLPPVGEVSDAMAVAENTDGILLVVSQHYCNRSALADTCRQFKFVNAKILGIVFNMANDSASKYGYHNGYYRRSRAYHKRYEGSYVAANTKSKRNKPVSEKQYRNVEK